MLRSVLLSTSLPLAVGLWCHLCQFSNELLALEEHQDVGCIDVSKHNLSLRSPHRLLCPEIAPVCETRFVWRQGLFLRMSRGCGSPCPETPCAHRSSFEGIGLSDQVCAHCCRSDYCNNVPLPKAAGRNDASQWLLSFALMLGVFGGR